MRIFELGIASDPLSLSFGARDKIMGKGGQTLKKMICGLGKRYKIRDVYSVLKVRMRGRGSGFTEDGREADIPLQICISCMNNKRLFDTCC